MVEMKVLGSHEEWLKARTKIGGSDASAIFGMSPYKTNVDLFKEKAYTLMIRLQSPRMSTQEHSGR